MGTNKPLWERPSFFKVMMGDLPTTLRIPPSFVKHLGDELRRKSAKSVLRNSRGAQWYAKIGTEAGDFFFSDGWESFVADHGIVFGDFLIFSYDGDIGFDVKIYGKSGCEKEDLLSADAIKVEPGNPSEEIVSDCVTVDRDKVSPRRRKRKRDYLEKKNNLCIVMRSKAIDNERVLRAACSLKTTNPFFVASYRKARRCYMTIPAELVKKYDLSKKKSTILRDPSGKSWPVRISSRCDGRMCLGVGWAFFCSEHCLQEGDVCVFEFVQGGNAIDIRIFRVEGNTKKSCPKSGIEGKRDWKKGERKGEERGKEKKKRQSNAGKPVRSGKSLSRQIEREGLLKAANSVISRHPKFISVWRLCRLYHMPIPKKVVKELGVKSDQKTVLFDPCGRTWQVDIICRPYGQVELGKGWSKFVRGNQLAVNDGCLFEFLGGTDAVQVHIFRRAEFCSSATFVIPEATDNKDSVILLG